MVNISLSIWVVLYAYIVVSICLSFPQPALALHGVGEEGEGGSIPMPVPIPVPVQHGTVVKKDQRKSVVTEEFGEISAIKVNDGRDGFYHLQFITMEPNSLFLPVHLHSDMVFYVHSGSGTLSWADLEKDDDEVQKVQLQTGDVYRLHPGSFFYIQSNLESERRKLRICAIFSDSKEELREGSSFGAYASVRDLVLGFDNSVLQAALNVKCLNLLNPENYKLKKFNYVIEQVNETVIQELKGSGERQPMIVHGVSKADELWDVHYKIMKSFLGRINYGLLDMFKNDKNKAYNILKADHDVENRNGWSLIVTSEQLDALKDSDFGIYLVNLTKGAMMGPHWNPTTVEIGIVVQGRGMVNVVCPSNMNETECKNKRFRVEEGDVFVVPRYHPMAQMSFNNGSFVFVGFTTTQKENHPQFLVGTASVLQELDKMVVAASFGESNTTLDALLSPQRDAIIIECPSCAEEEERLMEEEIAREEEERREREEEAKRREEGEERKKEEEAAKRREEEKRRKEEEEEARKKQEEEEQAAARQREEEEEAARRQEEAAARRQEEEEAAKRQEEEAARRQEKEAARQREKEEAAARRQEEAAAKQREEEEATRRQEEATRQREEEEAAARRQEEEEVRRRQEEEAAARQQEEARKRQEEAAGKRQREEAAGHGQGEEAAASRQEEEIARRQREAEAAARGRQHDGIYEE